jgi:hypothetical protein
VTVVTAVLIQVLVLALTLAAAGGAVPMPVERLDTTAMVDSAAAISAPACRATRAQDLEPTADRGACPSLTAGLVLRWIDQGRGPLPPPMA